MQTATRGPITCGLLGILILFLSVLAQADVLESARMLPDDVLVMVSIESVSGLRAALEKTSLYGLYKDPAMQPFVTETEKKVRELIDTKLKEFWQKTKIENPPSQIPYPEGRLVLGLSVFKETPADANTEESGGADMGFRFAVLADMGGHAEQARQMIRSLSLSAENAGTTVAKQEIGGVEVNIIAAKEGSDDPTLYYGFKDNWLLIVGNTAAGPEFTESVARRMGRSVPGSLADKTGLKAAARTLGETQVFTFVNADAIRSLVTSLIPNKPNTERIIQALGLHNVTGIATAVQIAGSRDQEMVSKTLIGIEGAKTGLPALLADASGPLKLNNRFVTRDAVGFVCANYTPAKLFDGIGKILQSAVFMDINMLVQAGMAPTAGEGGQPPVQLRDDVLAQMAAPLFVTWQMDKPYTFATTTRILAGLPVQDAARLNTALGRIHQAFLGAQPSLRRELLDHTLYLLPTRETPEDEDEEVSDAQGTTAQDGSIAFSVAGDHLVVGQVGEVEQAIRSLQKEPENALASDPMFRYARESLPSQACVYVYENTRLGMEMNWTALKQLVRDAADQTDRSRNPITAAIQKVKDYVDLNKLPEFEVVAKYWGASVGFMQNRPEGLYWESIALRPPQQ